MPRKVVVGHLMYCGLEDSEVVICPECESDKDLLSLFHLDQDSKRAIYHPAPDGVYLGRELLTSQYYTDQSPCYCCGWSLRWEYAPPGEDPSEEVFF